jgi:hypothetical protein
MTNKHPKPSDQPIERDDDLDQNPGIGQSKGLFSRADSKDEDLIEGDNTVEGDTENDGGGAGGISPDTGRTND